MSGRSSSPSLARQAEPHPPEPKPGPEDPPDRMSELRLETSEGPLTEGDGPAGPEPGPEPETKGESCPGPEEGPDADSGDD